MDVLKRADERMATSQVVIAVNEYLGEERTRRSASEEVQILARAGKNQSRPSASAGIRVIVFVQDG